MVATASFHSSKALFLRLRVELLSEANVNSPKLGLEHPVCPARPLIKNYPIKT